MLFVLGAGSYLPENKLSDAFLAEMGCAVPASGGAVSDRRSTIPVDILKRQRNSDLAQAMRDASVSCSEMGEHAARQAIERAGISVDQVGLVIADCVTPIETTPAESQRVAGRLGLKVPAYDIFTTNGISPAHFSLVSKWKRERVPDYILSVSTNAPTQRIDYSSGAGAWRYGDGASACVFSPLKGPGLELLWSHYSVDPAQLGAMSLDTLGFLSPQEIPSQVLKEQFDAVVKKLTLASSHWEGKKIDQAFFSCADQVIFETLTSSSEVAKRFVNSFLTHGDMIGTNSFFDIATQWAAFSPGQLISAIEAQGSPGFGAAVFRVVS